MTHISQEDIAHLAHLSSLTLTDEEATSLQKEIATILKYIEQLSRLDTTGVEPTYQVTELQNVWQEDIVDEISIGREQLLQLAPDQEKYQIKVPKVL